MGRDSPIELKIEFVRLISPNLPKATSGLLLPTITDFLLSLPFSPVGRPVLRSSYSGDKSSDIWEYWSNFKGSCKKS